MAWSPACEISLTETLKGLGKLRKSRKGRYALFVYFREDLRNYVYFKNSFAKNFNLLFFKDLEIFAKDFKLKKASYILELTARLLTHPTKDIN